MRLAWCRLALVTGALSAAGSAGAWAQALLLQVGVGTFPRTPDLTGGSELAGRILIGGTVEAPLGPGVVGLTVWQGNAWAACVGGCAESGQSLEVSYLWPVLRAYDGGSALLVGPVAGHADFDVARRGFGGALVGGAARGHGPRIGYRFLWMSGRGLGQSSAVWVGWRVGR